MLGSIGSAGPSGPSGPPGPAGRSGPIRVLEGKPGTKTSREEARRNIAYGLVAALVLLLTIPVVRWFLGWSTTDDLIKIVPVIGSALGGLVGAIIGFYFRAEETS